MKKMGQKIDLAVILNFRSCKSTRHSYYRRGW